MVPVLVIVLIVGAYAYLVYPNPFRAQGGLGAQSSLKVQFSVSMTHQEQRFVDIRLIVGGWLKGQFWGASCILFCSNGITYTLDPTVLITNVGRDFEQCKTFGASGTITCTSADTATVIGVSESSTTPVASDTSNSGPCKTTSTANEIESGGLTDVAGTVTAGTAGATVTTTVVNTFTAAETDNNVQVACLQTELHSGSNVIIYAEGTFGPDSFVAGNTLKITWSIGRT